MSRRTDRIADWAASRLRKPWLHDDLRAGALLSIARAMRRVPDAPEAYLATAARRGAVTVLKDLSWPVRLPCNQVAAAPDWTRIPLGQAEHEHGGTHDADHRNDERALLHAAVARLPEPWRRTMRDYLAGWPASHIATKYGIRASGVRERLKKGRHLIRKSIARRSTNSWHSKNAG